VIGGFLTLLLAGIVALALVAKIVRVPYPVVFVLGGLALALIPGIPTIALDPNLVFLLFLPALIFGDGYTTDARAFIRYRRPIFSLAIGLVVCTSVVVAFLTHWLAGLPLAAGFALGGILSPTDAVATDAIAEEVALPRRLSAVIGGESLVNDASSLVIYRFAVVAVATGAFSLLAALVQFVYVVVAGVLVGAAGAWLIAKLLATIRRKGIGDVVIAVSISLISPLAIYVPADAIGGSGVLAVMTAGVLLGRSSGVFDAETRIAAASVWNLVFFTFNGAAFVLIGLQLRAIVHGLVEYSVWTLIGWGLAVTLALIVVRFFWCFVILYAQYKLSPRARAREGAVSWQAVVIVAFAGMRGIVSLAAALAIPATTTTGTPFPARDLILFLTFVVILVTLVGEGLTMPWLVRRLGPGLQSDTGERERALALARVRLAEAARDRLRALEAQLTGPGDWEVAARIQAGYELRLTHAAAQLDGEPGASGDVQEHKTERRLWREAYAAERTALVGLRKQGEIGDDVYRDLEWDIDLAESRWT
jgi:CPA1 family monovalent cation:H+ antiporter